MIQGFLTSFSVLRQKYASNPISSLFMAARSKMTNRKKEKEQKIDLIEPIDDADGVLDDIDDVSPNDYQESDIQEGDTKVNIKKNDPEWMFFDTARVNVKGGDGGDGCNAMRREWHVEKGGPSGGNGGHGGSVYLECNERITSLQRLRRKVHHKGEDGTRGKGDSRHGYRGSDCVIPVPLGTIVRDENGVLAGELNEHGARLLVAKGGQGGKGNESFKTSNHNAPNFCEKGQKGAERWINVELKLIADVGFVGVPNAGKSTLLAASSNAKPKIASYAFTTVVPNLGVCDLLDPDEDFSSYSGSSSSLTLCDIPGLLEGAHDGKGLGLAFLRHIQRCKVIIHVVRGDSEDPIGDFIAINQELMLYNPLLLKKPQVVVVNKIDLPEVRRKLDSLTAQIKRLCGHSRVMGISAITGERVRELMQRTHRMLQSLPVSDDLMHLTLGEEERVTFDEEIVDDSFEIFTNPNIPNTFQVVGKKIEKMVSMTNWDYYEAIQRFHRILEAEGINSALKKRGAENGDTIMIGEWDFNFYDRATLWVGELGMENINPRKRPLTKELM